MIRCFLYDEVADYVLSVDLLYSFVFSSDNKKF